MAKLFIVKTHSGGFVPASDSDYEIAKKYKAGEVYLADIKKPRNLQFHRKFFALIDTIWDIQSHFDNREALRLWLIMKSGHFDTFIAPKGKPVYIPRSISFASMDDVEFERVYNDVISVAIMHDKICLGSTKEEIDENVKLIAGF